MFGKIVIIAVLCVAYTLAEAPVNRYRAQRLRQPPKRQFFARQEAPYPESSGGEPAAEYGPPTTPASQYGAPPAPGGGDPEVPSASNPDTEAVGQPSRLQSLPQKQSQKFSQRLELQQQVQQFPQQQQQQVFTSPVAYQPVVAAAPVQFAAPLTAVQQEGSYYIQLPSGSIQRVNYISQPGVVDNSVLAKLQFRPVAEVPVAAVQTTVAEPQLYVNTVVQSHVSSDQ